MQTLRNSAPDFYDSLLPNDDPIVLQALADMQASVPQEPSTKSWPEAHMHVMGRTGLRWSALTLSNEAQNSPWNNMITSRERDILLYQQRLHGSSVSVDLSQSMSRSPLVKKRTNGLFASPAMLPGMKLWLGPCARLLLGREMLVLQGYPLPEVQEHR